MTSRAPHQSSPTPMPPRRDTRTAGRAKAVRPTEVSPTSVGSAPAAMTVGLADSLAAQFDRAARR